jgi:hypothetical protein
MGRRLATPLCLMLLAVAGAVANASPALAAPKGSFVIHNDTSAFINYTVTWSNGRQTSMEVAPGATWAHWMEVDANGRHSSVSVSFDAVGGDDEVTTVSYAMETYLVEDAMDGKDYSFRYQSNGVVLELFEG